MKKFLLATLIVATMVTTAFATGTGNVNYQVQQSFEGEYKSASDVSWTTNVDYLKVTFVHQDQRMEAYYNQDGEKIGTARAISIELLPIKAKRAFAKKYDNYEVKESIVFEGADETAYFISARNEKHSVVVKVYDNGETSVYTKR